MGKISLCNATSHSQLNGEVYSEMAQAPGSPEESGRQTSLPGEVAEGLSPAIQALESYKKKDPSKGTAAEYFNSGHLNYP